MIYVLTGPVGSGKSMMGTQKAIDYASQGRRVAANYHIGFADICNRRGSSLSKAACEVIPDRPTAQDLEALGIGGPSEEKAGVIVIDEAGTFLNARTWGDKERAAIIRWMLLSRKRRWDMILIVQSVNILDKQIREAVVEVTGRLRRLDRVKVPGTKISLPRVHLATMRYGTNPNDVVIERWWSRGEEAVKCYDTTALFENVEDGAAYCVLPATLSKWRYIPVSGWMRSLQFAVDFVWSAFNPQAVRLRKLAPPPVARPSWVRRLEALPPDDRVKVWRAIVAANDAVWVRRSGGGLRVGS